MPTPKELIEKAAGLVKEAQSKMAEWEGKAMPPDVEASVDTMLDEAAEFKKQADREFKAADLNNYFNEPQRKHPVASGGGTAGLDDAMGKGADGKGEEMKALREKAFRRYLRGGKESLETIERKALAAPPEMALGDLETKTLSSGIDSEGGYVLTTDMRTNMIQKQRDLLFIRRYAEVIDTAASQVGFPSFDNDTGDAEWTAESGTIAEDNLTNPFGKRYFTPHKLARIFRVPMELVEDSSFNIEGFLTKHFAMRYSEIEENNYLNGNGVEKPLGTLKAGLNTVASAVTAQPGFNADDILEVIYSIRAVYRRNCRWMLHRHGIKSARKFKDNNGQYLWQMSLAAGQPDTLAGYPLDESEYFPALPSSVGSAAPVAMFCDWSYYWIVDRVDMSIQRLVEKYAEYDQIGFKLRKRTDGAPVMKDAFAILTQKA